MRLDQSTYTYIVIYIRFDHYISSYIIIDALSLSYMCTFIICMHFHHACTLTFERTLTPLHMHLHHPACSFTIMHTLSPLSVLWRHHIHFHHHMNSTLSCVHFHHHIYCYTNIRVLLPSWILFLQHICTFTITRTSTPSYMHFHHQTCTFIIVYSPSPSYKYNEFALK